jgi:hypothetical protein
MVPAKAPFSVFKSSLGVAAAVTTTAALRPTTDAATAGLTRLLAVVACLVGNARAVVARVGWRAPQHVAVDMDVGTTSLAASTTFSRDSWVVIDVAERKTLGVRTGLVVLVHLHGVFFLST